jgi:N-acetylmuramoyl-L-alanine amidase
MKTAKAVMFAGFGCWLRAARLSSLVFVLLALGLVQSLPAEGGKAVSAMADHTHRARCDREVFRVVLDIGHTLDAPGARSARGIPEYQFNLLLTEQIEKALLGAGFRRTFVLNTFGPTRAGLVERVARTNALRADLFLSIHHDSVPQFLKEVWEYDGHPSIFSDRFRGHSIFVSMKNRQHAASLTFARMLGRQLNAQGLEYTPHYTQGLMGRWQRVLVDAQAGVYRYDQLIVLGTTHMPAVLLEAGSIVNREEELLLASTERQSLIAASVLSAVEDFCASRPKSLARRRLLRSAIGIVD